MPERPKSKQNWQRRKYTSEGKSFRIDVANPQMGINGTDVYNLYAVTDKKDIYLMGLSEGGVAKIYNDQSLEIIAGQKSKSTGVDIVITGKNGDVCITAERDGSIRIRGKNIVLDADENIDLRAGKSISIKADAGKILLKSNQADCDALLGNLPPVESTFGGITFAGTYVGMDVLGNAFAGGLPDAVPEPMSSGGVTQSGDALGSPGSPEATVVGEKATNQLQVGESNTETRDIAAEERQLSGGSSKFEIY